MKKNIVVFMYNFPPIGAGRGIAWNKFCSHLSNEYNVNLITIEPSENDPIYNESKLDDIKDDFAIHRTSPGFLYRKMYPSKVKLDESSDTIDYEKKVLNKSFVKKIYKSVVRSCIFPDRMIFWNKSAENKFLEINRVDRVDLIVTVGFPFSTHLLGYKLKRKFGMKWIMDYGDPWSFNPSSETVPHFRRWLDRIVESKIIRSSDHITVTTDTTKQAFESKFKKLPDVSVVKQGVDYEMFRANRDAENKKSETLNLFYSGIFYKDIRNPENFFHAISKVQNIPVKVNIIIAGHMEDYVLNMVKSISFPDCINVQFIGNIRFDQVVNYQSNSDGLLFFGNKGALQVPGKIYEYLASRTPIFSVSYQYDAVSDMIEFYERGETSLNSENCIKDSFERFVINLNDKIDYYSNEEIEEFDWAYISNEMNNIVNAVVGDK
ncbi:MULTISPECIES: hypothetical protein [Vibrio]|uniref:Glycosyltransferase n=1 Tax=Vibrio diabolicus TaxID=50719 RepID=A0AAX1XU46_9VIBR|nr:MULTISPECIES: hypothetical protein [Vibrio]KAB2115923.1 glycosyltransferase family 4 protein [Vibrio alginolyticus]MBS9925476.1 hypothetical protein [Vibrio alginolyticus]MCR9572652.1 hypothetical protein [Vibrio alginolyticus]MCS0349129.1 hypothetical protein [Vibrio diabolicus]MCS0362422.1 hypothetical protein [Vibrio diabolicus]